MQKTALHPEHLKLGAKMTDFHGWEMPLYYTSILEEHQSVRTAVGLFDISHMGQAWIGGADALQTLNALIVSDLSQVGEQRACYTLLLNERGGIIDDIIVYRPGAKEEYLVIINCGNRTKDYEWLVLHRRGRAEIRDLSAGRSILAIQGPKAASLLDQVLEVRISGLGRFGMAPINNTTDQAWVARTGYTGGDGFEVFLPDAQAKRLWQRLLERGQSQGIKPVGLGARDTLRLEAGLRLYGMDMDDQTSPYEVGLDWTVAINKPSFIGKEALLKQKATGTSRRFIGFELNDGPVPRQGCALVGEARTVGTVTSGTFSPMFNKPIGMGYVEPTFAKPGTALAVAIRNKSYPITVVKLPFWHRAQPSSPAPIASERVPT